MDIIINYVNFKQENNFQILVILMDFVKNWAIIAYQKYYDWIFYIL